MSSLAALNPPPAAARILPGTVAAPVTATTCRYVLDDQPGLARGPARYLRPAVDPAAGPDVHDHAHTAPVAGTPCLVVVVAGSYESAWVIPFP